MGKDEAGKVLSEDERKAAFLALVAAQDAGKGVALSRKDVAEQFGITDREVRQIEREGLDGGWPPLG
jgi:DNA-directed RNA polymerase sigma subunit (sigma70/sigma32)